MKNFIRMCALKPELGKKVQWTRKGMYSCFGVYDHLKRGKLKREKKKKKR